MQVYPKEESFNSPKGWVRAGQLRICGMEEGITYAKAVRQH